MRQVSTWSQMQLPQTLLAVHVGRTDTCGKNVRNFGMLTAFLRPVPRRGQAGRGHERRKGAAPASRLAQRSGHRASDGIRAGNGPADERERRRVRCPF